VTPTTSAADVIEQLLSEYREAHPEYQFPPSGDRHPAILVFGTQTTGWLIERVGAPSVFLNTLLDAAKIWFPPGCKSREFRIFRTLFEGLANVSWGNFPEYQPITDRYLAWLKSLKEVESAESRVDTLDAEGSQ
jgi:hypothetical protein